MKKSQLREIILEELKGYTRNPETEEIETTQGGTTDDFMKILTRIAKGNSEEETVQEEVQEQNYLVSFTVGEDEDDVEVKASSPEEAISKVKSGKVELSYGQKVPGTARAFSAKVWNK